MTTYININGLYGCGPYGAPEHADIHALLRWMDHMGIACTVSAHTYAPDLNPTYGNRQLLADIEAAGVQGRIIPAFGIAPAMLYREGELAHLCDSLQQGRTAFVALFPQTSRYQLCEIEKVLARIEPYSPIVLVDFAQLNPDYDYQQLGALAQRFAGLTFILRKGMWGQQSMIMDLMTRHKNIWVDTSRQHVRGAVDLFCREFGAGRVVFGVAHKTHYGAPMAALAYSGIEADDKAAIAAGNVLALLKAHPVQYALVTAALARFTPREGYQNSLWRPFLAGQGVRDVHVVDAHGHIGPPARGWFVPDIEIQTQIGQLQHDLRRFGIAQLISSPETAQFAEPIEGNRAVERLASSYDTLRGYLCFNPHYASSYTRELLDEFFAREYFVGLKILPAYWKVPLDDPRYRTVWEYAHLHHLPVLIHEWSRREVAITGELAQRYPHAQLIVAHSGGGDDGREEAHRVGAQYPNVFPEFCGSFTATIPFEDTIAAVGAHKVLFGTDTYFHDIAWELGRMLSLPIDDAALRPILGENMLRILAMRQ